MVDYSSRVGYLRSYHGSQAKAAKAIGISRGAFQDLERGVTQNPTKAVRDKVNRNFRASASDEVKAREAKTGQAGFELGAESQAEQYEKSLEYSDKQSKVVARATIKYQSLGVGFMEQTTLYGRGNTVEEANAHLDLIIEKWILENRVTYNSGVEVEEVTDRQYRVYRTGF